MPATRFYYGDPGPWPEPNRPLRVAVIALITRASDGALLLEQRRDNGQWGPIGGGVDPYETPEQALTREVAEETGLTVVAHRLVGVMAGPSNVIAYPDGNVFREVALIYAVDVAEGPVRISEEAQVLRYVPRDEVLALELASPARFKLEQILAGVDFIVG